MGTCVPQAAPETSRPAQGGAVVKKYAGYTARQSMAPRPHHMSEAPPEDGPPRRSPGLLNLNALDQLRAGNLTRRLPQLMIGLTGYGAAVMVLVQSGLGAASWNVLAEGLSTYLGLTFGWTTNLIAAIVLLAWIPLRELPGLGTVLNICVVGLAADWTAHHIAPANLPIEQYTYLAIGLLLYALFDATYLGAQLGAGPRDGLMVGLTRVTGQPVRTVRTCIEVTVATVGWILGGTVGVGTIATSLLIGPLVGALLPLLTVRISPPQPRAN